LHNLRPSFYGVYALAIGSKILHRLQWRNLKKKKYYEEPAMEMYLYWAWNILLKWWFNLVQMKTLCFMRSLSPCVPKFNSMENVKYYFLETSFGNNTVNGIYDHCGMQIQTCTNEDPSFGFTYQLWLPLGKCPKKSLFFSTLSISDLLMYTLYPLDSHTSSLYCHLLKKSSNSDINTLILF
jgi:hypothetical protein